MFGCATVSISLNSLSLIAIRSLTNTSSSKVFNNPKDYVATVQ